MPIGSYMYFLEDRDGSLTFDEILLDSNQSKFQPIGQDIFSSQPSTSHFWFKVQIDNHLGEDLWMEIGDSFDTWYLDFYYPDSVNGPNPALLGSLRPKENRQFPSNHYCVRLPVSEKGEVKTYYFRTSGGFPKIHVFRLGTIHFLTSDLYKYNTILGLFLGVMVAMLVYNLFLFLSTREKVYLYYAWYLVTSIIIVPFGQGYAIFEYGWFWNYQWTIQSVGVSSMTLFASTYLNLPKDFPKLAKWQWGITGLVLLVGIANLINHQWLPHLALVIQPIFLLYNISLLSIGIYIWSKGFKKARFYVFGWIFVWLGSMVFILTANGIIPLNDFGYHSLYIGFSLEALMFSLALGDRLNLLKKEKEEFQASNLQLISRQKSDLEVVVNEKTKELQNAYNKSSELNDTLVQTNEKLSVQKEKLEVALEERNESQKQLFLSEKMAAIGVLAAGLGHEINNPLNFIKGGLKILKESLETENPDQEEINTYFHTMEEGVRRCAAITKSLSNYSRQGGDLNEACDVREIVKSCLLILNHKLNDQIDILQTYQTDSLIARGNEGKLHQVFMNVLTNAIQAVDRKGSIEIKGGKKDAKIVVAILDNGVGISETNQAKMADPFFTTKGPKEGIGLGLSISYAIIEEHGGSISCRSKEGAGTEFIITLPDFFESGK